jgi:ribosomal protein L7Ae-like RNA K-turn-binding protein
LPGRGVWVTATRQTVEAAVKRHAFARGFKRDARVPADLVPQTETLLQRAALDALAIAGKAGLVAVGFAKAAAALEHGAVVALLHAAEGSPDGIRKLEAVCRRLTPKKGPPVIEFLTAEQLDLALGRPNVVHAALLAGPASDTCLSRLQRLGRFRTGGAGDRGNRADTAAAQ